MAKCKLLVESLRCFPYLHNCDIACIRHSKYEYLANYRITSPFQEKWSSMCCWILIAMARQYCCRCYIHWLTINWSDFRVQSSIFQRVKNCSVEIRNCDHHHYNRSPSVSFLFVNRTRISFILVYIYWTYQMRPSNYQEWYKYSFCGMF